VALAILGTVLGVEGRYPRTAADTGTFVWIVGFSALAGSFIVTYARARIDSPVSRPFDSGIASAASRDVRLFVVMVGALTGQGLATLVVLALLSNGVVALRLRAAHSLLQGGHSPAREPDDEQMQPEPVLGPKETAVDP
jgi:hypothetical protein